MYFLSLHACVATFRSCSYITRVFLTSRIWLGQIRTSPDTSMAVTKTKLQPIREAEGLNRTQLAILADVSTRTIARIERREGNVTEVMKHKILNALNRRENRLREDSYEDLYDNEAAA